MSVMEESTQSFTQENNIFKIQHSELAKLQPLLRISEKNSTQNVQSNVILNITKDLMQVHISNSDMVAVATFNIDNISNTDYWFTIKNDIIGEIIKKIPGEEFVTFQYNGKYSTISAGNYKAQLPSVVSEAIHVNMDAHNDIMAKSDFSLSTSDFNDIIKETIYAVSRNLSRYYLHGVHFHCQDTILYATSSDAHRLSIASVPLQDKQELPSIIVSAKVLGVVQRLIDILKDSQNDTQIEFAFLTGKIGIRINNFTFIARLIDATYPNCDISCGQDNFIIANKDDLNTSIDRVSIISKDEIKHLYLRLEGEDLILKSDDVIYGTTTDKIKVKNPYNMEFNISLNARYMLDILQNMKKNTNEVRMRYTGSDTPVILQYTDNDTSKFCVMTLSDDEEESSPNA